MALEELQNITEETQSTESVTDTGNLEQRIFVLERQVNFHEHTGYDDSTKILKKFINQFSAEIYAEDSGSSDAYAVSLIPALGSYQTGLVINFKANTANTGACTLNVNALGAKSIKRLHDQDTETGDIESGQIVTVIYDGTDFQIGSQLALNTVPSIQTFTSSGTWTKPSGAVKVLVQAWGGGGSGAARTSSTGGSGGGGGGEYLEVWFDADDLGATETVTRGAGGSGGAETSEGTDGGNTTFGSLLTAHSGKGGENSGADGVGGDGGDTDGLLDKMWGAGGTAGVKGNNGVHSGGGGGALNNNTAGAGGNSLKGSAGGGGASGATATAGGTSEFGGDGGIGAFGEAATAVNGTQPGGGGGAAVSDDGTVQAGNGANGQVIVTTFI